MKKFKHCCIGTVLFSLAMSANAMQIPCSAPFRVDSFMCSIFERQELTLLFPNVQKEDFWYAWQAEEPLVSQTIDGNTFYGIGIFTPDDINELGEFSSEAVVEWIKQHGVTMSFGLSQQLTGSANFRIDYRWRDREDVDLMLQMRLPFK
ncbi:hypothetical protein [Thaumasiovibrio sp. DFM-14]|uniref:hypothetical protein n=1 Tax=Thaumasiovibrio sp. DFM-14 TaxID=3384792 RepID=UPI00399F9F14